jgi:L,D-transpeptidase YcbB
LKKILLHSAGLCALASLLLVSGCRRPRKTTSAPNTTDYSERLKTLTAAKHLGFLRWPNISDYEPAVKTFYEDRNYEIAWTRDGRPTSAARGFIQAFADAGAKGLEPTDYDSALWSSRIASLAPAPSAAKAPAQSSEQASEKRQEAIAQFDVAMTVSVMRFISDLRVGRVNPQHFNFGVDVANKRYNLAEFVSDHAVDVTDVPQLLNTVEPDSELYRRTQRALARYVELAHRQKETASEPLPKIAAAIAPGHAYEGAAELFDRLKLEGDLSDDTAAEAPHATYTEALAEGVKHFQSRHGFADDGKLTPQTIAALNVPMSQRVLQLQDALERWRWLPDPYLHPRLMVNLPEFVLRGYNEDQSLSFTMRVVVGKVVDDHQTPVLARMMRYMVFRPYWNVPTDIARKELVPHIEANQGYLESHNYEVINTKGKVIPSYTAKQIAQGSFMVREKPGPRNSLGLIKFMFPNQYDIYLHSTPATQLFSRTRRDFSHGCVRVQKPDELAAWLLDGQKDKDGQDWDIDKVRDALNNQPDNHQVNLKTPIPIVIFYVTAEVEDDGDVRFFDDIYGYDAEMQKVLAKGPPYPVKPYPAAPKPKPGDTV